MTTPPYDFEGAGDGASATTTTAELEIIQGSGNICTHDNSHVASGAMALQMHLGTTATCQARPWGTGVTSAVGTTFGTPSAIARPRIWRWIPAAGYAATSGGATVICLFNASSALSPLDTSTTAMRMWAGNRAAWAAQTSGITSATNTISQTATPVANGDAIAFTAIGAATNINTNPGQVYYVIGKTTNTFQVALQTNGTAITLGTATGLAYRSAQPIYITDGPAAHFSNTTGGTLTAVSQGSFDLVPFYGSGLFFQFEIYTNTASTTGTVHIRVSTNPTSPTTTVVHQFLVNNYNLGSGTITAPLTRLSFGVLTTQSAGLDEWIDFVDISPGGASVDTTSTPTPVYAAALAAPTAPTAVIGSTDFYPTNGATITLNSSSSTVGTSGGSITGTAWTITAPDGSVTTSSAASPTLTVSQDGRYGISLVVTQSGGGLSSTAATATEWVSPSGTNTVKAYSVTTTFTNEGGAVDKETALNDGGGTNYNTFLMSPPDPAGVVTTIVCNPFGDGPITVYLPGCSANGAANRTVVFKTEGGTPFYSPAAYALPTFTPAVSSAPTSAEVAAATVVQTITADSTAMTTLGTARSDRRAIIITVSDSI